jgi:hypothetical protein
MNKGLAIIDDNFNLHYLDDSVFKMFKCSEIKFLNIFLS